MTKDTFEKLKEQLFTTLCTIKSTGNDITVDQLDQFITFQLMYIKDDVSEEDRKEIKKYLESNMFVKHDHNGYAVVGDTTEDREWYTNMEHGDEHFWKLYKKHLIQDGGMDFTSLNKLGEVTLPRIMNCLGNPKDDLKEQRVRYGMVIGDVQSGKTSTYAGLICKAADAGMKVVILLAGQTETLRQQTQERMEEDIVGYTIRIDHNRFTNTDRVGVGKLDGYTPIVTAYTSYDNDFRVGMAGTMSSLQANSSLVMFVVKKNVPVLKRLKKWLTNKNQTVNDKGKLPFSLLLIDDEADNASVNTRKPEYDPTATNKIIRELCEAFMNSNYVGFTATPYANIFINPEKDSSMETSDLFPKDFIYVLPTPDKYIGAMRIFGEPSQENPHYGNCSYMLKYITDIKEPENKDELADMSNFGPIYFKHKREWRGELPQSLDDALKCFYIANAIRDVEGYVSQPRTMLVNISRFQDVESYIKAEMARTVAADRNVVYYDFSGDNSKDSFLPLHKQLTRLWHQHYENCGHAYEDIINKDVIFSAIEKIGVIVVNGSKESKDDTPDYKANPSLRLIAVGGLALSRGLTLRGLMTSYFYRNTATYDTLLQMGRWFGYRPNYAKLCQIWITNTSANWYRDIAEATEELKSELSRMNLQKLTPKEFGLRIRRDNTALEITARNKMQSASDFEEYISFWGNVHETPYFSSSKDDTIKNFNTVKNWFEKESENLDFIQYKRTASKIARDIPFEKIQELLKSIVISPMNRKFLCSQICSFVEDNKDNDPIGIWDVALIGGSGETIHINDNISVKSVLRSLSKINDTTMAFSHNGVISGVKDTCIGLDDIDQITQDYISMEQTRRPGSIVKVNRETWFKYVDRHPLLCIYLVKEKKPDTVEASIHDFLDNINDSPIVGLSIGIPGCGHEEAECRSYKTNLVYQMNSIDDDIDDDDLN